MIFVDRRIDSDSSLATASVDQQLLSWVEHSPLFHERAFLSDFTLHKITVMSDTFDSLIATCRRL